HILPTPIHSAHLFLFSDTPTTETYTLSLHDALPILISRAIQGLFPPASTFKISSVAAAVHDGYDLHGIYPCPGSYQVGARARVEDRKSTRLNSSHVKISYAVFCLKKKKKCNEEHHRY